MYVLQRGQMHDSTNEKFAGKCRCRGNDTCGRKGRVLGSGFAGAKEEAQARKTHMQFKVEFVSSTGMRGMHSCVSLAPSLFFRHGIP